MTKKIGLDQAQTFPSGAAAWVLHNNLVNENGVPLTFNKHRFLARPYMDITPQQVVRKASQVGWSTLAILRSFHMAKYLKANIIYTLPSRTAVKDFVRPKVNPLIENNSVIREMLGKTESEQLKSVQTDQGPRFIYYRGSWEESAAISISAHILINDEVDRSNLGVLRTYKTRLDAAKLDRPDLGWDWRFSNPSIPGFGVDEGWQNSDMKHWMIKCSRCNERQYLDFPDNIDVDNQCYICYKCKRPLSEDDRTIGTWIRKRFGRSISGYWLNQLMVPWIPATKIIEESQDNQAVFYNFTLGKPYISKDDQVTRESLLKCCVPDYNPQTNVAIGVDNAVIKTYVIGNQYGIFRIGQTESWEEIEDLRNRYNAVMVIDANPHPTHPTRLSQKYKGKVFIHYYNEDKKELGIVRWGEGDKRGTVYSDRTKIIDNVVAEINAQDIYINLTHNHLDDKGYIQQWLNMYRVIEESARHVKKAVWHRQEGKHDDYAHCLAEHTLITTLGGEVPIKEITTEDWVLTSKGFRKVLGCGMTHKKAVVAEVVLSNGTIIVATPTHKFKTQRGFIELHNIRDNDILEGICESRKSRQTGKSLMERLTSSTLERDTSSPPQPNQSERESIEMFGHSLMGTFLKVFMFITRIVIDTTTILRTFLLSLRDDIQLITQNKTRCLNVLYAKNHTSQRIQVTTNIALLDAVPEYTTRNITRSKENVLSVGENSQPTHITEDKLVASPVQIKKYRLLKEQRPVYDLSVDTDHEYYANGILVSNSTIYWRIAMLKTMVDGEVVTPVKKKQEQVAVAPDGTVPGPDLDELVKEALGPRSRSWKNN